VLHYHLTDIFRINPGISLYVGLFTAPSGTYSFAEVKAIQNYAGGRLRQVGVWCGHLAMASDDITAIAGVTKTLETQDIPLSVIYAPKITALAPLPTDVAGTGKCRISVCIGQPGTGVGAKLYADEANTDKASVSGLGVMLGILSLAKVHESIGWVGRFPTGVDVPAFGDGTLLRDIDKALVESLDTARYLFFVTYSGMSGSFINDSHTMDAFTSDYAMIENVRTTDKAVRGVRTYLLPELGGSLYVDPSTGHLETFTVEHLTTVGNKALEDMDKAGELSGYSVEIDPDQNVLSTSEVEIVIKHVDVGVLRTMRLKFGRAESV
jgi:hypothetical protein